MRSPFSRLPGQVRTMRPEVVGFALSLLLAGAIGYVLAGQAISPSKRAIEVLMGAAVLTAAFLLPSRFSIGFMLFIIPFPLFTTIGSTTVIFAYIIFAFWMLRVALGYERRPIRAGIEVPLFLLLLLFIVSFVNVESQHWDEAISRFRILISSILIFYMVLNMIRTEKEIRFTLNVLLASFFFVALVASTELWFPQFANIFKILRVKSHGAETVQGTRVGSVFGDYEMFAEYLAIFIPLILIRILTEKVFLRHLIWLPLLILAIMLLLSTATRGAFIAMIAGVVYLVWIARRILNWQKLLPILLLTFVTFYVSSIVLNRYTSSASLFGRLSQTKLVAGMPDTRARVWSDSWAMVKKRPWIGHGPYYFIGVNEQNVKIHQPHSLFLFMAYLVGIPGALIFYWILFIAWRKSYRAAKKYAGRKSDLAYTVVLLSSILVIFVVDEIKISFMRYENTQQFTWTMLALLIGSSRVALMRAEEEEKAKLESDETDR